MFLDSEFEEEDGTSSEDSCPDSYVESLSMFIIS